MKSPLAFVAGMLAGALLVLAFGVVFQLPLFPGGTGSAGVLTPARLADALGSMRSGLTAMLPVFVDSEPLIPPPVRYGVRRSLRMAASGVVVARLLPLPQEAAAVAEAPGAPAPVAPERMTPPAVEYPAVSSVPPVSAAAPAGATPAGAEAEPERLYARALKDYEAGRHDLSRSEFAAFLKDFPRHRLVPNALYWTGETWYSQGRYEEACDSFRRVVAEHRTHAKSPDALLKLAYSAMRLGNDAQAVTYLDQLQSSFPGSRASQLGRQARGRLQERGESGATAVRHG